MAGVGVGLRRELAPSLLARPAAVDFVEVVAEACREPAARREAVALAEVWPVVPHGVKLSLGSAGGIERDRALAFGRLARELRAPVVSEHVAFVRGGGREIGHLTELPMTRAAVSVVAANVAELRRALPDVPLLLENVARGFVWPEDAHEMSEGDFYAEILRTTGCELLLDLGNLYANALNALDLSDARGALGARERTSPEALLASFPLEHVGMVHVAGGELHHGFYFDTHAHDVPDEVFALVRLVRRVRPDVPVLLERDAGFEHDAEARVFAELARLREERPGALASEVSSGEGPSAREGTIAANVVGTSQAPDVIARDVGNSDGGDHAGPVVDAAEVAALADAQAALAERLTMDAPDDEAVERARRVLRMKRVDDALPLLPSLGPKLAPQEALELGRLVEAPRLRSMTAVADALRIARGALGVPSLASLAVRDEARLSARFASGEAGPRPRFFPYVTRRAAGAGRVLWAWKGFGAGSPVRLFEAFGGGRKRRSQG